MKSGKKIRRNVRRLQASKRVIVSILFVTAILGILIILSFLSYYSVVAAQASTNSQYQHISNNANNNSIKKISQPSLNSSSLKSVDSTLQGGSPLSITKSMRYSNESLPTAGETPYIAPNRNYVFSQSKNEVSTPNNNSHTAEFGKGEKIALVLPTFTASAYDNSFYVFYRK